MPSDPRSPRSGKRRLLNVLLAGWLVLLFVDALPRVSLLHRRLKGWVDPFLDVTGLWQGSWKLFAPEVDKIDIRLTAEISYSDGSIHTWHSPDWRDMSIWGKFINFRSMEYYDAVRNDENADAWDTLADYLARTVAAPDNPSAKVTKVRLARRWSSVPPVEVGLKRPFRARRIFEGYFLLREKNYQP